MVKTKGGRPITKRKEEKTEGISNRKSGARKVAPKKRFKKGGGKGKDSQQ